MNLSRRYGLVVKPFQVLFYQRGCFANMMTGNYMGELVGFRFFEKSNRAI